MVLVETENPALGRKNFSSSSVPARPPPVAVGEDEEDDGLTPGTILGMELGMEDEEGVVVPMLLFISST